MFSAIAKKNLNEAIASQITTNILTGKLVPGDKLPPERELASVLDVNRNTLREALRKLEILGLISIRQGDGIYVKDFRDCGNLELLKIILKSGNPLSPVILTGMLQLRSIVIPEMAAEAASNRTDHDLIRIIKTIENENLNIAEKDLEIHKIIAAAGGNIFYSFLLNYFNDTFLEFSHLYFSSEKNSRHSAKFHRQIYSALKKGDADKCRRIMQEILKYSEKETLKHLEQNYEKTQL